MKRAIGSFILALSLVFGMVPAYAAETPATLVEEEGSGLQADSEGAPDIPSLDVDDEVLDTEVPSEDTPPGETVVPPEDSEQDTPELVPNPGIESAPLPDSSPKESDQSDKDGLDEADASAEALLKQDKAASPVDMREVVLAQVGKTTEVKVSFPNLNELNSSGAVDRIEVSAAMNYGGNVTHRASSASKTLAEVNASGGSITVDFETYGKFSVTVAYHEIDETNKEPIKIEKTFGVVADEYNIAPVSATLPVTFFSLSLWGEDSIRHNAKGEIIPTIMLMERPNAWNWDNLPEGVYPLPYLTKEEIVKQPSDFGAASEEFRKRSVAMNEYVRDLYALNPNAKFNLYVVDYYLGLIQSILYANKIPQNQYTITVLSDGAFSYERFNAVYGDKNPAAKHATLVSQWKTARSQAYASGKVTNGYWLWEPNAALYAAVDAEPNAEWWLARSSLLETKGDGNKFAAAAQANTKVMTVQVKKKLEDLQALGEGALSEFKQLYNFSDSYFAEAEAAGKKVMMFLGTTVGDEAGSFYDYAKFTQMFYGDEYAYYYKGHPGSPTAFYPSKQKELKDLGITDVDSSIAAELILFFNPDIYLSGYPSSVYASLPNPEMAKGIFKMSKAEAMKSENYRIMDWFMSRIGNQTPVAIRALAKNNDSFLVEFSDAHLAGKDYTLAIWDGGDETTRYYREKSGTYELVRTVGNSSSPDLRIIKSKLSSSKVLDISSASQANGANTQLYANNRSLAQRFSLVDAGEGYYYIKNVSSGKVLDVASAGTTNGTNVWQYELNRTDAQKWKVIPTSGGEGLYNIVSKCNNLYLDVSAAGTQNGTNIQVWENNGTNAQKFSLPKVKQTLPIGMHSLKSAIPQAKNMLLDVSGASVADGANVQVWRANQTKAQSFAFSFDEATGCYTIYNDNSGKVIDVNSGASWSGANVWQYAPNETLAQKWTIEQAKNSKGQACYVLYSATGSGAVLDVSSAGTWDGTNVQIWEPNGTDAQRWFVQ